MKIDRFMYYINRVYNLVIKAETLITVFPKVAKRFIGCAIWVQHIIPLHSLNCSAVIAAAAELLS